MTETVKVADIEAARLRAVALREQIEIAIREYSLLLELFERRN